jgi:Nucleotidyl transferase AbiEii toxin, Type IV TA system
MVGRMLILSQRPDKSLIEEVALVKGINPSFVEKDWWVVQVLKVINEIHYDGFEIIFSGGTCLSKAHLLLQRFSEDIDFRVAASKSVQNRKSFSAFKKEVVAALRAQGLVINDAQIKARDSNRFFSVVTDYESYFSHSNALRPHILIELTIRKTQLPSIDLSVSSFVGELTNQLPEVEKIRCINPIESAADKLSAIAWRIPDRVRDGENDDPSLVRHLHDLAILKDQALAFSDFAKLIAGAMEQDENRAKTINLIGLTRAEKFERMLEALENDINYPQEYDRFVKGVSYAVEGNIPNFDKAMQAVRDLVKAVL